MSLSFGWIFLLGGILGFVKAWRAKSLSQIDGSFSEATENKPIKFWVRALILLLNLSLAVGGAVAIQRKQNWNPFQACPACKFDAGSVS